MTAPFFMGVQKGASALAWRLASIREANNRPTSDVLALCTEGTVQQMLQGTHMTAPTKTPLVIASYVVCALIACVNSGIEHNARGTFSIDGFSLWIASPFILLALTLPAAHSVRAVTVVLTVTVLLGMLGFWGYHDAMSSSDAQSALVFVFMPLLQMAIATVMLVGTLFVRYRARRSSSA